MPYVDYWYEDEDAPATCNGNVMMCDGCEDCYHLPVCWDFETYDDREECGVPCGQDFSHAIDNALESKQQPTWIGVQIHFQDLPPIYGEVDLDDLGVRFKYYDTTHCDAFLDEIYDALDDGSGGENYRKIWTLAYPDQKPNF